MAVPAVLHADPLGLLVAFGAGMLSFLSPCVLPLVPAYLSMVSGLSAAELAGLAPAPVVEPEEVEVPVAERVGAPGARSSPSTAADREQGRTATAPGPAPEELRRHRSRLLRGILAFIAGFTVVFTILGASASAVGRLFLTHQHALEVVSGILIVLFGALLVAMAAGVTLPMALAGEKRFLVRPSVLGSWAPPVLGMAFAFAWTPCIGPVLGSVLALAAGTGGSASGGIALLLAYSLGLGVPFLLSGLAFGRMTDLLARMRGRLRLVDLVGGVILVAFGVLLLTGNVDVLSAHISNWLRDLHLNRLSSS
ncbi:MAG TPA: cytochrome c biogenesis protein CcdA [Acidimicrobiales bacterium]|nr:cytochrome c biogenesis protein CcdA [Acidimicrobiales bacterium]